MLKYQQSSKKHPYSSEEEHEEKESLLVNTDNDDDDDEEQDYYKQLQQKKRRNRVMTQSSSPEPQSKKGRKKSLLNPNRKDKAGRTKLFSATTAGHLDKVKELIKVGADVNFKDNAGWTPLHEAALKGQYEIGKYLIECGAEINVRGFGLDTPLHDACSSNSPECVQLLVDAGADVFALNEAEKRPIDLCTDQECQHILEAKMKELEHLIARDKDGRSSLHRACLNNKYNKARSLIEQGADVNAKDNHDATPLHLACALGHLDIIKLLIDQGAIVNILGTETDDTPLHEASRHGHYETVNYLIYSAGADVNMNDKSGKNSYQVSAAYPLIRQLLTARMDEVRLEKEACNALDEIASKTAQRNEPERQLTREEKKIQNYMRVFANLDGKTHSQLDDYTPKRKKRAVRRKSLSVESDVSCSPSRRKSPSNTLVHKLDPTKKDTSGRTQLHKYAKRGDADSVKNLLELGANPNEKDYAGWTPLHEAALNGHLNVVKVLLQYGANANSKGADMDTPLHDATENNHCDIVELLLEHGADPFARNAHDAEPIDIATEHEFHDIILVLQSASPVAKKKRTPKIKREKDVFSGSSCNSSINGQIEGEPTKKSTKKRRLIQAADLVKNTSKLTDNNDQQKEEEQPHVLRRAIAIKSESDVEDVIPSPRKRKLIQEETEEPKEDTHIKSSPTITPRFIPTKKNLYTTMIPPLHSPIHTPPPEHWSSSQASKDLYSPLYTVQIFNAPHSDYYVIDLQISLFLGMSLDEFWSTYPYLNRKIIHTEGKTRLWSTLKHMIHEDKEFFVGRKLYFIGLDDVLHLIKRDFNHLSANLITITLDIGYSDEPPPPTPIRKRYNLPPKIAMKMKKCGFR